MQAHCAGQRGRLRSSAADAGLQLGRDGQLHVHGNLNLLSSKIVGTVGADDAFAAGVLYGLHKGCPVETSFRYGICVAGSYPGGTGAAEGIQPLKEFLGLEKTFTVRAWG